MSPDRVIGAGLTLLGVGAALEASTFDVAFMTDPVGPKALPYLVAAVLTLGGVATLMRPRDRVPLPSRPAVFRMIGAVAVFLVYALVLSGVGFFVSTTLVVTALALLYRGPLLASLTSAAILSGTLWLLFVEILSLPLPIGELWIR